MNIAEFFTIQEFVPKDVYDQYGKYCVMFFNPKLFYVSDQLRKKFGPTLINSWSWGGHRQYSGLRPPEVDIGARLSIHRIGAAIDPIFIEQERPEVYNHLINNQKYWRYIGITTILDYGDEDYPSHIHIDCRNIEGLGVDNEKLLIIRV